MNDKKQFKTAVILAGGFILWVGMSFVTGTICWFQAILGVPCPGCGSTRAALALLQGNFAEAFYWHPLIIVSLVILPYLAVRKIILRHKPMKPIEMKVLIGIAVLYLAVFMVRMILFFPHTAPMVMHEDAVIRQIFRLVANANQWLKIS